MQRRGSSKILIVDDDHDNLYLIALSLSDKYDVTTATSAEAAIELLKAHLFDLVITDITMPGASGLELCLFITQNSSNTIVIMMSGLIDDEYKTEAEQNGAVDYLIKPVSPLELAGSVRRALEGSDHPSA